MIQVGIGWTEGEEREPGQKVEESNEEMQLLSGIPGLWSRHGPEVSTRNRNSEQLVPHTLKAHAMD